MTILGRTLWCSALIAAAPLIVHPAAAQSSAQLDRLVDQLQQQMQVMQQQNQEQMQALQRQHQKQIDELREQIQTLQKQVQQAQQQQPRKQVRQAQSQQQPQQPTARPGVQPQPAALAAAPGPAAAPSPAPAAVQPPSAAVRPPAAAGPGPPEVIVGVAPSGALAPPPAGVHVLEAGSARFGIESADGRNAIFLTGRLQFDAGDYLDYRPGSRFAAVQDLNSGVNARRARLGVVGRFARDWDFTLIYDLGGTADGFPPDPGARTSGIQQALLTYNGLNKGPLPLAFDIGYLDLPFTLGESVSSNDIPLVERAAIVNVASNIFANDFRSALGVRSYTERYWAGLYLTGPQSGATHNTGEQIGILGRATYQVLQSPEYWLHLGVDAGALLKPPAPDGIRSITLTDRPELRVDPTQILSTGALGIAANPLNNAVVYGVEAAAAWRNFLVDGEYYHIDINRLGLATNGFDGGYIQASWVITGEQRKYTPPSGGYLRPVPEHPLSPWDDQWGYGAFELAARWSTINLNDDFTPGVAPPRGSNAVGGGKQTVYSVGLNWYPNANIRFMFDYLHGNIDKKFSIAAGGGISGTPLGTPVGGEFDAVVLRTQVAF